MSIQGALHEMRDHLEQYVAGYAGTYRNYDGMHIRQHAPSVFVNGVRPPAADETEEEYLENIYPFVLLRASAGQTAQEGVDTAENEISVIAVIGVRYPGEDMQGAAEVADLIDRIITCAAKQPYTAHTRISPDVRWQLDDDDTHPYYFGAATLTVYDRTATRDEYNI